MIRWSMLVVGVALLSGCGSSGRAASTSTAEPGGVPSVEVTTEDPANTLDVRITASTHLPRVGTPWRYVVRARTADGKPVPAQIAVRVLYQGVQAANLGTHNAFTGVWSGTFTWPPVSRAHVLVVEATATSNGRTGRDTYQVAGQ